MFFNGLRGKERDKMKVLVTGSAGFIGSALCLRLLARGDYVIGLDNHNDYYDPRLKEERLARHVDHQNRRTSCQRRPIDPWLGCEHLWTHGYWFPVAPGRQK